MTDLWDAVTETLTIAKARPIVEEANRLGLKFNIMQKTKATVWLYFPDYRDAMKLEATSNIKITYGR